MNPVLCFCVVMIFSYLINADLVISFEHSVGNYSYRKNSGEAMGARACKWAAT